MAEISLTDNGNPTVHEETDLDWDQVAAAIYEIWNKRHPSLSEEYSVDAVLKYIRQFQEAMPTDYDAIGLTHASKPKRKWYRPFQRTYEPTDISYQGFVNFAKQAQLQQEETSGKTQLRLPSENGHILVTDNKIEFVLLKRKFNADDALLMVIASVQNRRMMPPNNSIKINGSDSERILIENAINQVNQLLPKEKRIRIDNPVTVSRLLHPFANVGYGNKDYLTSHLKEISKAEKLEKAESKKIKKLEAEGVVQKEPALTESLSPEAALKEKAEPHDPTLVESLSPQGAMDIEDEVGPMSEQNIALEDRLTEIQGPVPDETALYLKLEGEQLTKDLEKYDHDDIVGYTTRNGQPVYKVTGEANSDNPATAKTDIYFIKEQANSENSAEEGAHAKIIQVTLNDSDSYYTDESYPFRTYEQDKQDKLEREAHAIAANTEESLAITKELTAQIVELDSLAQSSVESRAIRSASATAAQDAVAQAEDQSITIARQYAIYHQEAFKGQSVAKIGEIVNKLYKRDNPSEAPLNIDSEAVAKTLADEGLITTREAKYGKTTKTVIAKIVDFEMKDDVHNLLARDLVKKPEFWVGKTLSDIESHIKAGASNRFDAAAQAESTWKSLVKEGVITLDGKGKNAKIGRIATGLSNVQGLSGLFTKAADPAASQDNNVISYPQQPQYDAAEEAPRLEAAQ